MALWRPPGFPILNRASPLTRGLVFYAPLTTPGYAIDLVNNVVGVPTNIRWVTDPIVGPYAVEDDGGGTQEIDFSQLITDGWVFPEPAITVSYWNFVATAEQNSAFGNNHTSRINCHSPWSNGDLYWDYGISSTDQRTQVGYTAHIGKWTLVTLTCFARQRVYFDGLKVADESHTHTESIVQDNFFLHQFRDSYYHNGKITNFCIWDRQLDDAEIYSLYKPASRWGLLQEPDPVRLYSFLQPAIVGLTIEIPSIGTPP
ncbi:MAG: LamG-like jellyroll fold domain-containing protein [Candidatus Thorarchaeota archaeon]|jgi:hypothetical protein